MTIVLADDITGAAEIAGISIRYGMKTSLVTSEAALDTDSSEVVVVATDIRSCTEEIARKSTEELCEKIKHCKDKALNGQEIKVFKKTDSVLRGHIHTELSTIMDCLNYDNALLLAQNPSKGRTIKDSTYYIGDTRLSETLFSKDPEFPAKTSMPTDIVGDNSRMLATDEEMPKYEKTIFIAEASTKNDIAKQINKANDRTLLAGGADLFEAYISKQARYVRPKEIARIFLQDESDKLLVVSGSTQGGSIMETNMMRVAKGKELSIPNDVFEGADARLWIEHACEIYDYTQAMVIRIGKHEFKGADYGNRLKRIIANATETLVTRKTPQYLVIEGGATAFAVLSRLGWNSFEVEQEFSPGVVELKHKGTEIILKPGSYPWGNLFD